MLRSLNCVYSQDEIEDEHLGTGNKEETLSGAKVVLVIFEMNIKKPQLCDST